MHLGGAGVEEHLHDLAGRRAPDDRVVDDHESLPGDLGQRVELHPDPLLAHPLLRLDERAVDVAVLDQPLAERDPGRAREADRGRRARVGDRQHEVGLGGRLGGEPLAHPHPGPVHLDAVEPGVGPGEVEELEDAERAARRRAAAPARTRSPSGPATSELAGPELALEGGADQVERAGLRCDHRVVAEPAEHERAEAVRVAEGEERPSASPTTAAAPSIRSSAAATASSSGRSSAAIRAAITSLSEVEREPARKLLAERVGVDQVAVVPERDGAGRGRDGSAAGRSPRRSSRSSSSGCARSRARRGAPESFCSSKTCVTSPRSRRPVSRPSSETAIPADSCPRCWSAYRPK